MTKAIVGVIVCAVLGCFAVPLLLMASILGPGTDGCSNAPGVGQISERPSDSGAWDAEQLDVAATIVDVGVAKEVPRWGWVIAVATALQESGLRNLPFRGARNDRDSLGVFQQRPSQGWGTARQLADPRYQAAKFFDKLLTVDGWQQLPLTQAAQAVQVSALPDAYATWTDDAITLVDQLTSTLAECTADVSALPSGFALPADTPPAIVTAIFWAIGQLGTPYHFGGACTDPHSGDPDRQCDCSSLMQAAYRAAGIAIPRVTTDQAHAGTEIANAGRLRPGDLILIPGSAGTMASPRHVGMYLGQNLIIQAPKTGDVVKISGLATWRDDIATIRRIVVK